MEEEERLRKESEENQPLPSDISGIKDQIYNGYDQTNAVAVSCGGNHTAILLNTGRILTFGNNDNGQLGNGKELYLIVSYLFNLKP